MARIWQSCHGDSGCVAYSRARRVDDAEWRGFSWGMHSVEWMKWICRVLCLRPVSGLWVQSTECISAELSVQSDSW